MGMEISGLQSGEWTQTQILYRQFTEATQEPLRLSAAITGFFRKEDIDQAHRDAYGAYIRRRIRPAAALLIDREDTEKLTQLAALGWMDERLIEEFLKTAQTQRKPAALVCLLQLKKEYFGFHDRDFSL